MKVKTVVVGVDGSECGQRALEAAIQIADPDGSIHVVSAYDAPSAHRVSQVYASVPEEFKSNIDLLAGPRSVVTEAGAHVTQAGATAIEHFVDNDPASAILDVANEVNADLIVVGSRGLGRASQVVRGSVSTKIAHYSQTDFMVVH